MAYDFSTLDHHDFELLARDILNSTFNLDLQDFKAGKDKGIDLRYSTPTNSNAIVVQAKHWLKSGYDKLYGEMEKVELSKIKSLKPDRYLLVTSVSLGPTQKDELVTLLSPFVQSAKDIFGTEDLNKYLSTLPDIEKKWYKLWLTSTTILQQVLHNGILGANEFVATKIKRTTQLYVHCPSYDIAFDILKEHKYILITGQPGVGKTTLAYYLTYHYLASGYQLLYVDTDLTQASTLLSADPDSKQIIFFDDFLGEIYLELNKPKATETAIVLFLERILASENKYLIMTTRTTVYTHALSKYEKLDRMKVDIARKEIVLDQYSLLDKARILQKHIFYSEIPEEYKQIFFENRNYWNIIDHANYNPRLIEFVTSKKHIPKGTAAEYWQFVLQTLHNPKEVGDISIRTSYLLKSDYCSTSFLHRITQLLRTILNSCFTICWNMKYSITISGLVLARFNMQAEISSTVQLKRNYPSIIPKVGSVSSTLPWLIFSSTIFGTAKKSGRNYCKAHVW